MRYATFRLSGGTVCRGIGLSFTLCIVLFYFLSLITLDGNVETKKLDEGKIESNEVFVSSGYALEEFEESSAGHTVRLISFAPRLLHSTENLRCRNNADGSTVRAHVYDMGGPAMCKWWNYFVDCTFPTTPVGTVGLFSQNSTESPLIVPVRKAAAERHAFVVCMARMFYFDNWRVALTAIELYRHHGASLFSIPIISVISELYTLLQHYETLGFVRLTEGVVMPMASDGTDPNFDVEFFNQVISNTECLYENRRSDFIAFADVDDVLIPRVHSTLHEELVRLSNRFPGAGSFEFLRDGRTSLHMKKSPKEFSFDQTLSHLRMEGEPSGPGKTVVIPSRFRQGLIHRAYRVDDLTTNYTHQTLGPDDALMLHLRNYVFETEWNYPADSYVNRIDYSLVQRRFMSRLTPNRTALNAFYSLPPEMEYYDAMAACYLVYGKRLSNGEQFCPNPLYCKPPPALKLPSCVVFDGEYESRDYGQFRLHRTVHKRLIQRENCFYQRRE